jgi:hypothetical protein
MADMVRAASDITDQEFLTAYNNSELSNNEFTIQLKTTWDIIRVKLRSTRIMLHTLLVRTGGVKGTCTKLESPALEAKIWEKNKSIQSQPVGPYITLDEKINKGLITIDDELNIIDVKGKLIDILVKDTESSKDTTLLATVTEETNDISKENTNTEVIRPVCSFVVTVYGNRMTFTGNTRQEAIDKLINKLIEENFSKVCIQKVSSSGRSTVVGIMDLRDGEEYKVTKQATAA